VELLQKFNKLHLKKRKLWKPGYHHISGSRVETIALSSETCSTAPPPSGGTRGPTRPCPSRASRHLSKPYRAVSVCVWMTIWMNRSFWFWGGRVSKRWSLEWWRLAPPYLRFVVLDDDVAIHALCVCVCVCVRACHDKGSSKHARARSRDGFRFRGTTLDRLPRFDQI
jgi:hypothetical protein